MPATATTKFQPGDTAIVRGSFEVVEVVHAAGEFVLVKRAGGQAIYEAAHLEPYSDTCPLP